MWFYLKVHSSDLRERLKIRNKRFDTNAFPITEEILFFYLKGFEIPKDEGEIVIENYTLSNNNHFDLLNSEVILLLFN